MDKKAKDILFKTFWSAQGWREDRSTSPEDFAYAKAKGFMFDPISFTHDECVNDIVSLTQSISPDKAARAFLSSLSSRRLDWRSSAASYFIAKQLAPHTYSPVISGESYDKNGKVCATSFTCITCRDAWYGLIGDSSYSNVDLNVLNFERLKWGGVRHGHLEYLWFDLHQLQSSDIPEPTTSDIEVLRLILQTIASSQASDHAGALLNSLAQVVKSSKNERRTLIEILAHLGILVPASYDRRIHGRSDWPESVACWRGEDQYDREAAQRCFGPWLREAPTP